MDGISSELRALADEYDRPGLDERDVEALGQRLTLALMMFAASIGHPARLGFDYAATSCGLPDGHCAVVLGTTPLGADFAGRLWSLVEASGLAGYRGSAHGAR